MVRNNIKNVPILQAGVNPTFVPFREQQVNVRLSSHGPASLLSILANICTNLTVT